MRVSALCAATIALAIIGPTTASVCRYFHDAECSRLAQKVSTIYQCSNPGSFFNPGRYVRCYQKFPLGSMKKDPADHNNVHIYSCARKDCKRKKLQSIDIHAGNGFFAPMHPHYGHGVPAKEDQGIAAEQGWGEKRHARDFSGLVARNVTAKLEDEEPEVFVWAEHEQYYGNHQYWYSYCTDLGEEVLPYRWQECYPPGDPSTYPIIQEGGQWEN